MRQLKWIAPLVALSLVLSWGVAKAVDAAPGGDVAAKGSITGTVTDASGAALKGVKVTFMKAPVAKHTDKAEGQPPKKEGAKNETKTDEAGKYTFADVPAGDYVVAVKTEAGKGMAKVTVKAGEAATADIQIKAANAPKAG